MRQGQPGRGTSDLYSVSMRSLFVPVPSNTIVTVNPYDRALAVSHMMTQEYKTTYDTMFESRNIHQSNWKADECENRSFCPALLQPLPPRIRQIRKTQQIRHGPRSECSEPAAVQKPWAWRGWRVGSQDRGSLWRFREGAGGCLACLSSDLD